MNDEDYGTIKYVCIERHKSCSITYRVLSTLNITGSTIITGEHRTQAKHKHYIILYWLLAYNKGQAYLGSN